MFKLNSLKAILLTLVIASLAIAACGQTPVNSKVFQPSESEALGGAAPSPAQGTYTTRISQADLPPNLSASEDYLGILQLKLGEEGNYSTILNGEIMGQGRYYFLGDELVFSESRYSSLCPTAENNLAGTSGTYSYSFNGQDLVLKVEADDCAARNFFMQVHPLNLV